MPVTLEGGCRVSGLKEGVPVREGALRVWRHAGRELGARAISLRVLELPPGGSATLGHAASDEVLFVLEGEAAADLDGRPGEIGPDTGLYVRPGARLALRARGPIALTLLSAQCPDPGAEPPALVGGPEAPSAPAWPVVRLSERAAEVTGDRWYRVLVDRAVGCEQVTQFVGAIPPGRAPDHFHEYEEVLCVLQGTGRMWAGRTHTPVGPGSCVFLPRRQVHCMENTGGGELRLLGMFYPAGSPAVSYSA
jgi:mannose-6-phosphate isomerase-like protein (cupin superfamily)